MQERDSQNDILRNDEKQRGTTRNGNYSDPVGRDPTATARGRSGSVSLAPPLNHESYSCLSMLAHTVAQVHSVRRHKWS